jgi:alkanesulfonate monooxygenase
MWSDDNGAYVGKHYQLAETLCSPKPVSSPRPRIMIGGGGEKKTLRLVAQYADASNMFGGPADLLPKYAILAAHCKAVGRDFTEIERTNLQGVSLSEASSWGRASESADQIVERFGRLADAGVQHVIISTGDAHDPAALELLGSSVLPQLRSVEAADPRHAAALPA